MFVAGSINAQNLIPNPSFENYISCINNIELAVQDAYPWYVASGTPDGFQYNCNNNIPLSTFNPPIDGDVYLGLSSGPTKTGFFFSESIGVPLVQALETGKAYYFEMYLKSFKINGFNDNALNNCPTFPTHSLGIYLSDNPFKVEIDIENQLVTNSYTEAKRVLVDSTELVRPFSQVSDAESPKWQRYCNCFIAEGGEQHLGISPVLGQFSINPPCVIDNSSGSFRGYYYYLDKFALLEVPDKIEADTLICEDEATPINIRDFLPTPIFDKALIEWDNGQTDSIRSFKVARTVTADLKLPCTTVPFELILNTQNCGTTFFVPTAFSPDFDGTNDDLIPFAKSFFPIKFYEFKIFNRWGQILYQTNQLNEGWDGRVNGEFAAEGVYVWQIRYQLANGKDVKTLVQAGDVTLMR